MGLKSIRYRIVLGFLVAGLVPFTASLFFVFKKGEEHLEKNIINQQFSQLRFFEKVVVRDFHNLQTELHFWAGSQILNDILVDDIDKRIQKFLITIREKREIEGVLAVADREGKVIASTERGLLGKKLDKKYLSGFFTDLHSIPFLDRPVMKFSVPVFSQFGGERIGYFLLFLFPEYFKSYALSSDSTATSLYHAKTGYFVGKKVKLPENIGREGYFQNEGFLVLYKRIGDFYLKNWYIAVQIDRQLLFAPINSMKITFLGIAVGGVFLILLLSTLLASRLVRPIEALTQTADYISRTKDYSKRVAVEGDDEIAVLSRAFNRMLGEIENALEKIREENRERLRLFTKLIEIINKINLANSEREVVEIATRELKEFLGIEGIRFVKEKKGEGIYIPVDRETVKGFIHIDLKRRLSREEEEFFRSIGRMVNLYIERLELLHKAQSASQAKSSFLSNISHELRTPLNSIIGFAQFLQMGEEDHSRKKALHSIEVAGRHLLEIINDILDFAKTEAGAVKVNKTVFPLKKLLDEVRAIITPAVEEKGLELIFPEDVDFQVNTDYRLLKQVLLNLLSNAVKFTEKGSIRLKVYPEGDRLFFEVIDTGIGIPPQNLKELFKDFTQLENPLQKKYRGTGLGLAISRRYVELLGGEIWAESEGEGKGAKFVFYIPFNV
ncbi:MAG: HAMP domain-containing protein [Aquificae bacterium]|nr:HAMP domain-containing protein [Aquificota bacterium]